MTILNRYITIEFLKVFLLSLSAFVVIYLIVDVLENINQFLKRDVPTSSIIEFFLFKIPPIVVQVTPVATLLSSIITLGILSRNSELIAIMASGINIYRILVLVLGFSFLVSIVSLVVNESIVPYTNQRVKYIENTELKKKKPLISFKQNRIWYRSKNAIYNIDLFDPTQNTLQGITIFYFDREFNLIQRIDARTAKWINKKWLFHNVSSRFFENGKEINMEKWERKIIALPEVADDFKIVEKSADEMSYRGLKSYVKKIKAEGYDATKYLVDLHAKLAFPFASLIMSLIGIPFALKTKREKGIISGVGMSILISFGYWIMFSLTLSFGHGGILPPIVSAWISNFTFLIIGIFMLLHMI
ncbi:MAG: LPS export ABC transporter permease LptG [Thermodesulfobacteriota bacterium]|nr:LPS export ABC transporter permease LptG [Thermodesulfobacteriota bacterium]